MSHHLRKSKLCCPLLLSCLTAIYFILQYSDELKHCWTIETGILCALGRHNIWFLCNGKFSNFWKLATNGLWGWWCPENTNIKGNWGNTGPNSKCGVCWDQLNWISLELDSEQLLSVISHVLGMSAMQNVVQALKHTHSLQLWFHWPDALCDFLVEWCSFKNICWSLAVLTLTQLASYVALPHNGMMSGLTAHVTGGDSYVTMYVYVVSWKAWSL